jgi:large-conductance mechanosensitive channel
MDIINFIILALLLISNYLLIRRIQKIENSDQNIRLENIKTKVKYLEDIMKIIAKNPLKASKIFKERDG